MCFPESILKEAIILATNNHIQGASIAISKFYLISRKSSRPSTLLFDTPRVQHLQNVWISSTTFKS
ncbi:hypothetical protein ACHAW6_001450 [Cyclotella cf. meneghiniana]